MDYGSGVLGDDNSEVGDKIQFTDIKYYLGIHPKTPLPALEGDTLRKDFVILQLYWWLFSSTKHCS